MRWNYGKTSQPALWCCISICLMITQERVPLQRQCRLIVWSSASPEIAGARPGLASRRGKLFCPRIINPKMISFLIIVLLLSPLISFRFQIGNVGKKSCHSCGWRRWLDIMTLTSPRFSKTHSRKAPRGAWFLNRSCNAYGELMKRNLAWYRRWSISIIMASQSWMYYQQQFHIFNLS